MTKTKIFVESFGANVRISLAANQDEIAENNFVNLVWVIASNPIEGTPKTFVCNRASFIKAVHAFRSPIRYATKNKKTYHPFEFEARTQRNDIRDLRPSAHNVGEYQDTGESWGRLGNRMEKYFDKVAVA